MSPEAANGARGGESGEFEMFIRSERLFLRPAWPEEWAEIRAAIGHADVARNLADASWPQQAADAPRVVASGSEPRLPQFVITLPGADGARLIGGAGLHRDGEEVALDCWIARGDWGQGYATEAARALLSLARALGHRRVIAHHFADDPASGRVLSKSGFARTGRACLRPSLGRDGLSSSHCYAADLAVLAGGDDDSGGGMQHAA